MKLLLSSRGLANDELTENFISFAGSRKAISIITTASANFKERNKNTVQLSSKLSALGFKTKFVDIEFEDPSKLEKSDLIIVTGGNPYYLLHHFRKGKSMAILKNMILKGTPFWGISAGFMILMRDLMIIDYLTPEMNHIEISDKKCMGLIDEIVIPHYDRFVEEKKISKENVDKFEMESDCKLIRLGELQCLKYESNGISTIGQFVN